MDDLRVKMCIQIRGTDFVTIHHELGHNFYQRAYKDQPFLFKNGANDGFHEAIGDAIALAITPEYLHQVGLLENVPQTSTDIPELLKQALDRVAFLPFGLMIDQWRWKVFSGEIAPADYNKAWWALRLNYQGVAPPVERSEADFDPGAKYHVAANVPYTRYFLAPSPATKARSIAAPSTARRKLARNSTRCSPWARANPGRTRWRC
jgi:peptidyl-dipeptidase A